MAIIYKCDKCDKIISDSRNPKPEYYILRIKNKIYRIKIKVQMKTDNPSDAFMDEILCISCLKNLINNLQEE